MPTTFTNLSLSGVILVTPHLFADARGYFMESYNESEFKAHGIDCHFVQDNQSCSSFGVIRGLHYQRPPYEQAKLIRALTGCILDVVVDARPKSATLGKVITVELSAANQQQLFIPSGCLHGFAVLSEQAIIAYKCNNSYHPEAEIRVRYDDPQLNIHWPIAPAKRLLSPKDQNTTTTFEQLQAILQQH